MPRIDSLRTLSDALRASHRATLPLAREWHLCRRLFKKVIIPACHTLIIMRFDHIGVPTKEKHSDEMWVDDTKVWVTDPAEHPYYIEYLRYRDDSPVEGPVREENHVAFRVDDLDAEIEGENVLLGPFMATDKLRVVFVEKFGVVFEFMDYREEGDWFEGEDK